MVKQGVRFCCKPRNSLGMWPVYDSTTNAFEFYPFRSQARRACALMNGKVTLPDPATHITNTVGFEYGIK